MREREGGTEVGCISHHHHHQETALPIDVLTMSSSYMQWCGKGLDFSLIYPTWILG
jgi:hypothetical protein